MQLPALVAQALPMKGMGITAPEVIAVTCVVAVLVVVQALVYWRNNRNKS
jgi:hypothetical protein